MRKQILSTSLGGYYGRSLPKLVRNITLLFVLIFASFLHVRAQDVPVQGRVTTSDGEGIPGVTVVVKGTATGTVTDSLGNYSISVPDSNAVLQFSYMGYETKEATVGSQSQMNIALASDSKADEVVVIGYGTQKRKEVTGAVSSVSAEEINQTPVASFDQAIQGRVPGVQVTQSSGAPGAAVSVQIRGTGTMRTTEPLYVIDGYIVKNNNNGTDANAGGFNAGSNTNALSTLNPNDIESIEILKDAAASSIYGARAANGVVIITTKRGKLGAPKVDLETYVGVQKAWKTLDLLNAEQNATLNNEARANAGQAGQAAFSNPAALGEGTDWQGEMFRSAPIRNHYLSISGGSATANYLLSGGYFNQEGTMLGTGFNRYSFRANSDIKAGKRFKFGESLFISRTTAQREPWTQDRSQVEQMIKMSPHVPVYNPDNEGGFAGPDPSINNFINPVGQANLIENVSRRTRFLGTIYGEVEIIKGLKYKLNLGSDIIYGTGYLFTPSFFMANSANNFNLTPSIFQYSNNELGYLVENTLAYNKTFGIHNLGAVVGVTQQTSVNEGLQAFSDQLPSNNIRTLSAGAGAANRTIGGQKYEYAIRSFFGRVNYSLLDRYLASFSLRRDGSSNFSPNHRYGTFASISGGWRISQEAFMEDVTFISDLKLRASWGKIGNDNIDSYGYSNNLNTKASYVLGNSQSLAPGITQTELANSDLKWESTAITNFGLDLGLMNNKLYFTADYFIKTTTDLLVRLPVPMTYGVAAAPFQNAGEVRNTGIELALNYQELSGDFTYGLGVNFTSIKNEVLSLGGGEPIEAGANASANTGNITRTEVGQPIAYFYGYKTDGLFQTDAEAAASGQAGAKAGDIKFKDLDGDGDIDADDRGKIGSPMPDFMYGINANAGFKGFDLTLFFQGVKGNEIFNVTRYWLEGMADDNNHSTAVLDHWTPTNTDTDVPRAVADDPNNNRRVSDRFVENGSYFRLKTLQLGYTLPEGLLKSVNISKARVYFTSYNLFTITKYSGYDPELAPSNQSNLSRGIDTGNYPQSRSFIVGAQLGF